MTPVAQPWTLSLRVDGAERAYVTFPSAREALQFARALAGLNGGRTPWIKSGHTRILNVAQTVYVLRPAAVTAESGSRVAA
jgi:hypothetical protein